MKSPSSYFSLAVLLAASCGGDKVNEPGPLVPAAIPIILTPHAGVDAAPSVAEMPACDLQGQYRLQFLSNGREGWWFRFEIDDGKARLVEPVLPLDMAPGTLALQSDGCELQLSGTGTAARGVTVDLALDPSTSVVSGTLTRQRAHKGENQVAITGFYTPAEPQPKAACVVPGTYQLRFDKEPGWKAQDAWDTRSCRRAPALASPMVIRVEAFGDSLAIGLRERDKPYQEARAINALVPRSICGVSISIVDESHRLEADLNFGESGLTGVATKVAYQIVEETEEAENIWTCVGERIPLVIKKLD